MPADNSSLYSTWMAKLQSPTSADKEKSDRGSDPARAGGFIYPNGAESPGDSDDLMIEDETPKLVLYDIRHTLD